MSQKTTLNNLADFCKKEQSLLDGLVKTEKEMYNAPSEGTILNILNYSKAVSIRKSKFIGQLEFVLN